MNDFENAAIKMAKKEGCRGVICGHIHQPADFKLPEGHYLNSGDWVENRSAILVDQNNNFEIFYFK